MRIVSASAHFNNLQFPKSKNIPMWAF